MSTHGEMLKYGLRKDTDRDLVFIDDAEKGLTCDCVCPYCGHDLIAKNRGAKKEHHFAHASGAECAGARMTALHLLAQNILEREKKVMLPGNHYHRPKLREFTEVALEQVWKDNTSTRRPDCTCTQKDSQETLWVEINCCHEVDKERAADIKRRQQACIEIDFYDLLGSYDESVVVERLTKDTNTTHRRWIYCPEEEARIKAKRKWEEWSQREKEKKEKWMQTVRDWEAGDYDKALEIAKELRNQSSKNQILLELIFPNNSWFDFIKSIRKDSVGDVVFKALLNTQYNKCDEEDISKIESQLKEFSNKASITDDEKRMLEQLCLLKCVITLQKKDEHGNLANLVVGDTKLQKEIFVIASVVYKHIIGFDGNDFNDLFNAIPYDYNGLTNLVVNEYPEVAELYLTSLVRLNRTDLINSKIYNELRTFANHRTKYLDKNTSLIIKTCFL